MFAVTTTGPSGLLRALTRAGVGDVDVDLGVAVLRLLSASALTRQVPFDDHGRANGVPPAAGERGLDRHHLNIIMHYI